MSSGDDTGILKTVTPTTHDLGNFKVRRAVPSAAQRMVGPFVFVDQFGPAQLDIGGGMDVRPHPHINLATVTWLFAGEHGGAIEHRDSLGTRSTIRPGTVNLMTAGTGIVHSERSPQDERATGPKLFGMQTWLALPDGREEIDPAFEAVSDLPVLEDDCVKATVIMGELWGKRAATTTYAETINAEILLGAAGSIPIDAGADERALMLVQGEAEVDGQQLGLYELTVLKPGAAMTLRSDTGARVFLLGGEAFSTKRHVWWNFVSSDRDRIEQAKEDWREGRFPEVPGDTEEFIPLPDGKPKTVSYP
ncbi:pirin family protein [Paraurantiacibacter namhicola]|uniref:Quercetin 2,3-dioxygenase n=1 Tax=Paraurantiacibacter namhicola TaxID=645517 RepID=A0A1C7D7N2_9SPHN|nr:pirin family protein [Paraurantiacibacter namhicola]ANU07458.1 Quercetin 2,3-dioxygenase [Paraurantiacibacter namhicola]